MDKKHHNATLHLRMDLNIDRITGRIIVLPPFHTSLLLRRYRHHSVDSGLRRKGSRTQNSLRSILMLNDFGFIFQRMGCRECGSNAAHFAAR